MHLRHILFSPGPHQGEFSCTLCGESPPKWHANLTPAPKLVVEDRISPQSSKPRVATCSLTSTSAAAVPDCRLRQPRAPHARTPTAPLRCTPPGRGRGSGGDIVGGPVEPDAHERPAVTEASALKTCGAWCAKRTASTMSPQRQEHVRSSLPTRPLRCRLRN